MGRPSKYTDALATLICDRLANGDTLRAICEDENLPTEKTVRSWAIDVDHPFSSQYARAREIGYHKMADDLLDIADNDPDPVKSRLRVEARKWLLSKALPKIYGDRTAVDLNVKRDAETLSDAELQHIAAAGRTGAPKKTNGSARSH